MSDLTVSFGKTPVPDNGRVTLNRLKYRFNIDFVPKPGESYELQVVQIISDVEENNI